MKKWGDIGSLDPVKSNMYTPKFDDRVPLKIPAKMFVSKHMVTEFENLLLIIYCHK